jgi:hypothetical protein
MLLAPNESRRASITSARYPLARLLLLAALLAGAGCQPDRLPLAPAPPRLDVVAMDDGPVTYRSFHVTGAGGFGSDATAPEGALKAAKVGDPATPSYASTKSLGVANGTKDQIKKAITDAFKDADDNDVSVLTISSHGAENKLQTGSAEFTGTELKELLGTIKGTKIVIISSCFSGSLIDEATELPGDNTVVLVSTKKDQKSNTQSPMFAGSTRGFAIFMGWIVAGLSDDGNGNARADADKNGEVTVQELFDYAAPKTKASAAADGKTQDPQNTFDKPGGDQLKKVPILKYKKGTLATNPDTPFGQGKPADQCTPIRCSLGTRTSSFIDIVVQAPLGLEGIDVLKAVNASLSLPPFALGFADPLSVRATKLDLALSAQVELRVRDVTGDAVTCDPVLVTVSRSPGAPVSVTLTGVPQAEHTLDVSNGVPGLTNLRVEVNGRRWELAGLKDGESRTLDLSPAMRSGANTVVLTPVGRPGGSAVALIHD